MKFSTLVISLAATSIGSASAFAPAGRSSIFSQRVGLASTTEAVALGATPATTEEAKAPAATAVVDGAVVKEAAAVESGMDVAMPISSSESNGRIVPGRYNDKAVSIALPFMKRPAALDGSHAGDYGFDPLGFTQTEDLYVMQEAELRHARLAMLAVVGWPMAELLAPDWLLQANGCAPSVLNGFNPLTFLGMAAAFGAVGYFEFKTSLRRVDDTKLGKIHEEDMADVWKWGVAGDYNWDPMNLYESFDDDAFARKGLRELEISHGRSAMLGITAFAGWEFLTGHPIVENSMFFHPNALLPALVAGYFAFYYYYEIENDEERISVQLTSEGEARMENLKMSLPKGDPNNNDDMAEKIGKVTDLVKSLDLTDKVEKVQKWYIANVVEPSK